MVTDAAKRAADALNKRREAQGLKRVTVWLSAEARFKLDAMKKAAGSKDRAAEQAIMAWTAVTPVYAAIIRSPTLSEPMRMPRAPVGSRLKKSKGK